MTALPFVGTTLFVTGTLAGTATSKHPLKELPPEELGDVCGLEAAATGMNGGVDIQGAQDIGVDAELGGAGRVRIVDCGIWVVHEIMDGSVP